MTTLNSTIQVRRGTAAQMPTVLLVGELYFQTDTSELYAGTGESVVPVSGGGAVASVFGRTGTVVAEAGDYSSVPSLVLGDGLGDEVVLGPSVGNISIRGSGGAGLVVTQTGSGFGATHAFELSDTIASVQSNNGALTVGGNSVILEGAINEAPTPSALDNSTKIATTAYTDAAVAVETSRAEAAEALLAPKASPALTGTPTAPTQTALTNNTDIATTAYTDAAVAVETSRAETAEGLLVPKSTTVNGHALSTNVVVSAGDITTGTLPAAQLPNPSASTLGGVESIAAVAHNYLTSISTSGVPAQARPVLADLSDTPAQNLVVASPVGGSGALTARALDPTDLPVVASTGTPALQLPTSIIPSAGDTTAVFGTANTQQCIEFVMSDTMTFGHVTVYIGTGVTSATMGVAIYSADGSTELAKADSFSVDTSHTGAQRIALSTSVTLYAGKTYWIAWTATTATTLTCQNYLMTVAWQAAYCAGAVRVGNSGTATSGGKCNSTLGTITNTQIRLPVMIFD